LPWQRILLNEGGHSLHFCLRVFLGLALRLRLQWLLLLLGGFGALSAQQATLPSNAIIAICSTPDENISSLGTAGTSNVGAVFNIHIILKPSSRVIITQPF